MKTISLQGLKSSSFRYIIIQEDDLENLHRAVINAIDEGWTPQGGVAVDMSGFNENSGMARGWHFTGVRYLQAMIKEPPAKYHRRRRIHGNHIC